MFSRKNITFDFRINPLNKIERGQQSIGVIVCSTKFNLVIHSYRFKYAFCLNNQLESFYSINLYIFQCQLFSHQIKYPLMTEM